MSHDYRNELDCAVDAAVKAGELLRAAFHAARGEVDHLAEEEIQHILTARFPLYGYLGEELGILSAPKDSAGHLWRSRP